MFNIIQRDVLHYPGYTCNANNRVPYYPILQIFNFHYSVSSSIKKKNKITSVYIEDNVGFAWYQVIMSSQC